MNTAIRPALETLRELDSGMLLDKLAIAIHDATNAVQYLGKKATITLTIEVAQLSNKGIKEPVICMEGEVSSKLPKPDTEKTIFYIDNDGNPTTQRQVRQPELGLSVAPSSNPAAESAA